MLPAEFSPAYLRQLEMLNIRSRRSFLGTRQGGYISPKKGHGMEFSDFRKYELGDSPRDIDWGVYARTNRLYIKRFQEEQELGVTIIIDTTSSMHSAGNKNKWDAAVHIALSLAYIALAKQNKVKLALPGYLDLPPAFGLRSIHRLGKQLLEVKPVGYNLLIEGVRRTASSLASPGVAILISDFLMPFGDIEKIINSLMAKNLEISALQVLGPADLLPIEQTEAAIAVDSESGEELELSMDASEIEHYNYLLKEHIRILRLFLAQKRIAFSSLRTDQSIVDFVIRELPRTGLLK
jgi:uncharacterized protein (DUF58 family)